MEVERPEDIHRSNELVYGSPFLADKPIEEVTAPRSATAGQRIDNRELPLGLYGEAKQIHEARSSKAQAADESFNAKIAPTINHWLRNPNKWDLPEVDTVSEEISRSRAEGLLDTLLGVGMVKSITRRETLHSVSGVSNPSGIYRHDDRQIFLREDLKLGRVGRLGGLTEAHEAGHALDYAAFNRAEIKKRESDIDDSREFLLKDRRRLDEIFEGSQETIDDQLDRLTVRARGAYKGNVPEDSFGDFEADMDDDYSQYRGRVREKMADAFALTVLEPRATKREAPELFKFLQEQIPETGASSPFVAPR